MKTLNDRLVEKAHKEFTEKYYSTMKSVVDQVDHPELLMVGGVAI